MDVRDYIDKFVGWWEGLRKKSVSPAQIKMDTPSPSSTVSIGDQLVRQGVLSGEDVNASLAEKFEMPIYSDLSSMRLPFEVYKKLPYSFVKKHVILPIKEEHHAILVAVADPLNLAPLEEVRYMLGREVRAAYAPKDTILSAINDCYNMQEGAASQLLADLQDSEEGRGDEDIEVYDLLDVSKEQAPIIKLLNLIITEAIQQGASDIHFEPFEDTLRVRYRIDGVLHKRHTPATDYMSQLLTRVKVMAKLDIAERRLPQDGRIRLRMGRRDIDFRVSTIPVVDGERIVLRILDKGNVVFGLDKLGMLPELYQEFNRIIQMPEGIVLVTGPTGSGKTTTLYSAIHDLYDEEINIMTIEDPVEYNLKGIAQMGVKPNIHLDFAAGLRTILRQDPDVIMVGEIRDVETAEIAIQAALTGHLVLSTLHTNDAPSAITRLVDMGVEPYLLSSCVIGVLAQRLVRMICSYCKEAYTPSKGDLEPLEIEHSEKIYRGKGCDQCFQSGYKGRHGVYELMTVTPAIQKQIVTSPDAVALRTIAKEEKMITLRQHAQRLVLDGITTPAEAMRILS
ncbi:MAG: GspE/PulE family protein [Chlamydiales bacterium]